MAKYGVPILQIKISDIWEPINGSKIHEGDLTVMGDTGNHVKIIFIEWGYKSLASLGYTLKSNQPENVQDTPWSYVIRFATVKGYIYLKHTPALLALEASIIHVLRDQFHAPVPEIIAYSVELNCFLMKDAGGLLREILKQKFDADLACRVIDTFTLIQLSVADHMNAFFDMGVPDWRLDKLPVLYSELIAQKDMLMADGLSSSEIDRLEMLAPEVYRLCKKLSCYPVRQTIVQPDFNDNNTRIDNISHKITIIDLGEIAVSHPFFSLLNFLQQMKKHHGLKEEDGAYLRIRDACIENYLDFASREQLLDALETAGILLFIYGALGNHWLMLACEKERFVSSFKRHGRPAVPLKEFMAKYPLQKNFKTCRREYGNEK